MWVRKRALLRKQKTSAFVFYIVMTVIIHLRWIGKQFLQYKNGYVGFHLDDVMIECPKCHKFISNSTNDDHHLTDTKKPKQNITIEENEFLF